MSGLTFTPEALNLVFEGNSNMHGSAVPVDDAPPAQLAQLAPLNGNVPCINLAGGGHTITNMLEAGQLAQVQAAYAPGKQNFLFVLEVFNEMAGGASAAQLIAKIKAYNDAVHAVQPDWRIYWLTTPAYQDDNNPSPGNAIIDEVNAYLRVNYWDLGCEGIVEIRPPGGPLAFVAPYTYDEVRWTKGARYYRDPVHLSGRPDGFAWGNGCGVIAQYMANTLLAAPAVAPTGKPVDPEPAFTLVQASPTVGGKLLIVGGKYLKGTLAIPEA